MNFLRRVFEKLANPFTLGLLFTSFFTYSALQYYVSVSSDEDADLPPALQLLRQAHQYSIDWRLRARGPRKGSERVVILTVDEKAVEQEGRWPWPRTKIKDIINKLMGGGAKVIGFDIVFADPVNNSAVVALEGLKKKYQGDKKFHQAVEESILENRSDRDLGEAVENYAENLVLGAYFDNPIYAKFPSGYQNLCVQKLYETTFSFEQWDNLSSVIIPIDETAIEVPEEMTDTMSEQLKSHFSVIEEKTRKKFMKKHIEHGYSKELSKTAKIELQEAILIAQWEYCSRWLGDKDEDKSSYEPIWSQIQEEDETLADYGFSDGIDFFKDRQLNSNLALAGRWWMNLPDIAENASHVSYFNAFQDRDGSIRYSNLVIQIGNHLFPSLALRTFLVAKGYLARVTLSKNANDPTSKGISSLELSDEEGEVVGSIPVDLNGRLKINYAGPQKMFGYLSVADVLSEDPFVKVLIREKDEKTGEWVAKEKVHKKSEYYKDKVFVFGATATGIYDLRVTPFEKNFPGVETHANLVDNMLRADYLTASTNEEIYMVVLLGLLGLLFSYFVGRLESLPGLFIAVAVLVIFYFVDQELLFGKGVVVHIVFPVILVLSLYFILTIYKYFTEERNKKQLKGTFGKYVSPAIVDEILADPANIELGGRKEHISVFFSDVRGFTTISEKLDAATLSDLLNSYLTPMTEIIFDNKGTLDKYMGDAIMAFFGAPISHKDHAAQACRAALQNLEKLTELQKQYQEQGLPMIDVGIGINTGEMSVGNMGSEIVRNYTVMGDAVNLGARLEGINKQYGTRIIVSEFTQKEIASGFTTREIDWVRVKGKVEPVKIFELICEGDVEGEMGKVVSHFNDGFKFYHEMQWQKAMDEFTKGLNANPGDAVSKLYLQRCTDYLSSPPPQDWDGVFTMTTK